MNANQNPTVSIGFAVYNGERYIREAVESILSQTYTDFELIISDNASTDNTATICMEYAAKDPRILFHRNSTNIGGANNENLTYTLSKGKYFRWAAHDDVLAPRLLEKLVNILDHDPETVLAYSEIQKIDSEGNSIGLLQVEKGGQSTPSQRLKDLYTMSHDCETTYGLIRSEALKKTFLQQNYTDSDRTLLAKLALYGKFTMVKEVLFYKRYHSEMSTQVYKDWRERMNWFSSANAQKITMPYWMQFFDYLSGITQAPISFTEKMRCYSYMLLWPLKYHRAQGMIGDLVIAIVKTVGSFFQPKDIKRPVINQ